ncbi:hypothetical protein Syun_006586 [Stephania yunnanensis]|uniref:Gnk2-homologous domain-containing protein n=1 Tax=Stephania yunnanensis TaxID=152371 RepID=A0AAP0KZH4_9MAGN
MKTHHSQMVVFLPRKPLLLLLTIIIVSTFLIPSSKAASSSPDFTTLVYKGCANQTLPDPNGVFSQTLNSLFNSLITQSSKSKFFKTTSGGNSQITGLFQCRGDLSATDCYTCVSQIPQLSSQLCGAASAAARIQLRGCYALYEASGFPTVSGLQLLYKVCGRSQISGSGFEERRDTALAAMESGIGGGGFFVTSYQSVYVLGQCEGDLGAGDCRECVKTAARRAQVECGSAVSGQVYLYKCYINYAYYANGVSDSVKSSGSGQNPGKTIAIVVGGVAAAGFGVILLLFLRSLLKKHDDD